MTAQRDLDSGWLGVLGSRPVRSAVNLGFHLHARLRTAQLAHSNPVSTQEKTLAALVRKAGRTRFGREHQFERIQSVGDFQRRVPIRTYEAMWEGYFRDAYPRYENLTWPGEVPFLALTSGTTQGATKYIPVTAEMLASNRKAAQTMIAYHLLGNPESRLFAGRMFFLGGATALELPAPGVRQGDLSGIAAVTLSRLLRTYTFPPLELALDSDWDRKLAKLAEQSVSQPITLVGGVPSWLLLLFERVLQESGNATVAEVWPRLELVVHGGVKFDPYRESFRSVLGSGAIRLQETYPCSEGFIAFGDPETGLLRLVFDHGIFYEFVPLGELDENRPTRHWLGTAHVKTDYAIVVSTCAGMWAHLIGDTIRFESLDPPLFRFTGRTSYTLSAFGEHLINEEVEGAIAQAGADSGAAVRDWHVGSIFSGTLGYHQYVVEFISEPDRLDRFREVLDADLSRRNADYLAHRAGDVALPLPAIIVARPGSFESWMRSRGKLGGQNKVPRMDSSGSLTVELVSFLRQTGQVAAELAPKATGSRPDLPKSDRSPLEETLTQRPRWEGEAGAVES
jgi:hypothetical protein